MVSNAMLALPMTPLAKSVPDLFIVIPIFLVYDSGQCDCTRRVKIGLWVRVGVRLSGSGACGLDSAGNRAPALRLRGGLVFLDPVRPALSLAAVGCERVDLLSVRDAVDDRRLLDRLLGSHGHHCHCHDHRSLELPAPRPRSLIGGPLAMSYVRSGSVSKILVSSSRSCFCSS